MRIVSVGGGAAGLYFAILMKKADPSHVVEVYERNRVDDTFGFGVVFSDATQDNLRVADRKTHDEMMSRVARWDDIHIHYRGELLTSTGHGFAGLSRPSLLEILYRRCEELGVNLCFESEITDLSAFEEADLILGADGVNSMVRDRYRERFRPTIDVRPNRFAWLGTTRPFPAFTFFFKKDRHGLWRIHAYQYDREQSTFIVETTEETWRKTGLAEDDEDATVEFCQDLFAEELEGHPLLKNRSIWRHFPTVRNERWSHENVVLLGDAAHTAHFSVGSGTKLAMEDAIALSEAIVECGDLSRALQEYEEERRPAVESLQRAAQVSLEWFEETERYLELEPIQFGFSLLTRSLRITHENLKVRDPAYIRTVDRWFAAEAAQQSGRPAPSEPPPPMFNPFRIRDLVLPNRVVVSPMCQYCAREGTPGDWHLVHLGSRALGGAGLVMTEMTCVSPEGRITPGCAGMYTDEHLSVWKRIADFCHQNGSGYIGMQLGHSGRKGSTQLMWEGMDRPLPEGGWEIMAPSPLPYFPDSQVPREMDRGDMDRVKESFVRSAQMAAEAGFDMLELHMGHGYLLASFISPLTNRREDEYGGALEARMRYPLEVFDAVRAVWPEEKPISVRISAVDWAPRGLEVGDAVEVSRMLKEHGCDIVDVSSGNTVPDQEPKYGRQYQTPFSEKIRMEAEIPTMTVGNISSYGDVNSILAAGRADLCVLARAHLWDPYWTHHAARGQEVDIDWPDQYHVLERYTPRFE